MGVDSGQQDENVDLTDDELLADVFQSGTIQDILEGGSTDTLDDQDEDDGDLPGVDVQSADEEDDEQDDDFADEDEGDDELSDDSASEDEDDEEESADDPPATGQQDPPPPAPDPVQAQIQALQAQNAQILNFLAQQQAAQVQQQQAPPPQTGPDPQVRSLLRVLLDRSKSKEEIEAAARTVPLHVQNEAIRLYQGYVDRDVDRALGLEQPQAAAGDVTEVVQQAVQSALAPYQQQQLVNSLVQKHSDVIQNRDDLAWVLQKIGEGNSPALVIELHRARKKASEVARESSKTKRKQRDERANKRNRQAQSKRNRRRSGKKRAVIGEDDDLETIAAKVMASGEDEIPDGLLYDGQG